MLNHKLYASMLLEESFFQSDWSIKLLPSHGKSHTYSWKWDLGISWYVEAKYQHDVLTTWLMVMATIYKAELINISDDSGLPYVTFIVKYCQFPSRIKDGNFVSIICQDACIEVGINVHKTFSPHFNILLTSPLSSWTTTLLESMSQR